VVELAVAVVVQAVVALEAAVLAPVGEASAAGIAGRGRRLPVGQAVAVVVEAVVALASLLVDVLRTRAARIAAAVDTEVGPRVGVVVHPVVARDVVGVAGRRALAVVVRIPAARIARRREGGPVRSAVAVVVAVDDPGDGVQAGEVRGGRPDR
jgi:hypothetical protein